MTVKSRPTDCTSLNCISRDSAYCPKCSNALYFGEGKDNKGKAWRWSFSPYYGPLFLRKDGEPMVHQPSKEDHPAWGAFERWQSEQT